MFPKLYDKPWLYIAGIITTIFMFDVSVFAEQTDVVGERICAIVAILQGNFAKGIATIAIMVLGVGAFTGKMSWTTILITAVGIIIIFSAGAVVSFITGEDGDQTCEVG